MLIVCLALFYKILKLQQENEAFIQRIVELERQELETENQIETLPKMETEIQLETQTEPAETEPVFLAGIQDLKAGTVLDSSQIDPEDIKRYFTAVEIQEGDSVYQRINGKSYQKNDHVALSDLSYIKLLHYNFNNQPQVGEIIVNQNISKDILDIFEELYQAKYEIQSMNLIDDYWTGDGDSSDYASIDVNNTSAFCYREVTGGGTLSNHAYGLAVDLNPQQNPYIKKGADGKQRWAHENANDYIQRDLDLAHVITHEDKACQVFFDHGFEWGGDWKNPKDYQHFDKAPLKNNG